MIALLSRLIVLWAVIVLPLAFWPPFEDAFKLPQWVVLLSAAALACAAARFSSTGPACAGKPVSRWLSFGARVFGPAGIFLGGMLVAAIAGSEIV